MLLDFYASQSHFGDHLRPIYEALPDDMRGDFKNVPAHRNHVTKGRVAVASAIGDYRDLCQKRALTTMNGHVVSYEPVVPTVLFEHGAGFSFQGDERGRERANASYAGGLGRGTAALLPATNRYVAEANRRAYPNTPSPIVGCPKLDAMTALPAPRNERPRVCVSFHWDCRVAPETRWAFAHFGHALPQLVGRPDFELVMHAHPRVTRFFKGWSRQAGIPFIDTFAEVCKTCDVYVNDASSTIYEFAATGRPVVVLNAPEYRRGVHHGLRFWEHADVGLQVDHADELLPTILRTLADDPQADARAAAVAEVYPYLGESIPRTINVLADLVASLEGRKRG